MKKDDFSHSQFGSAAVRYITMYRRRKPTVALVHGLFAHEGYWLPYLKILEHYRLVLVGVDYSSDRFEVKEACRALDEICRSEGVQFIVGHSLGASLVRLSDQSLKKILICDVSRASESKDSFQKFNADYKDFASDVVEVSLKNTMSLLEPARKLGSNGETIFVPSNDQYFEYPDTSNFDGDHFNIESALLQFVKSTSGFDV